MKNIFLSIAILLSASLFGQPNKNKIDSVLLQNNSLYQFINGVKQFRGSVILPQLTGIVKDANDNVIIGIEASLQNSVNNFIQADNVYLKKSHNNSVFAKNAILDTVNGTFSSGADHIILRGADYSTTNGDGNKQGGYTGYVDGSVCQNYVEYGRVGGNNSRNGIYRQHNQFTSSDIYGTAMVNEGSYNFSRGRQLITIGNDITAFGYVATVTTPGFHIVYGTERFGVLPNGKIIINGLTYTFPSAQGVGSLVNDGFGNLSWSGTITPITQSRIIAVYDRMGNLYYKKSY